MTETKRTKSTRHKLRRLSKYITTNKGREINSKEILNELTPNNKHYPLLKGACSVTNKMKLLKQPIVKKTKQETVFRLTETEMVKKWNN